MKNNFLILKVFLNNLQYSCNIYLPCLRINERSWLHAYVRTMLAYDLTCVIVNAGWSAPQLVSFALYTFSDHHKHLHVYSAMSSLLRCVSQESIHMHSYQEMDVSWHPKQSHQWMAYLYTWHLSQRWAQRLQWRATCWTIIYVCEVLLWVTSWGKIGDMLYK